MKTPLSGFFFTQNLFAQAKKQQQHYFIKLVLFVLSKNGF